MRPPPLLLAAGYLTIDISCHVDRIGAWDERVTAAAVERWHGGMTANVACAAARLGSHVRFFGHADTDALGEEAVTALAAAGVDTSAVVRAPRGGSLCVILVGDGGRRMIVTQPLDFDWRPLDATLAAWNGRAGSLHVDGYRLPDALPRTTAARSLGLTTSVDLDGLEDVTEQALADVARAFDIVLLNAATASLAGVAPHALADQLVRQGAGAVCVTLGGNGVVVATRDYSARHIAGVAVETVDTTGAGDAFAGAFLHRFLSGDAADAAAVFANAAAALSTTAVGARGRLPASEEVRTLLAEQRVPDAE